MNFFFHYVCFLRCEFLKLFANIVFRETLTVIPKFVYSYTFETSENVIQAYIGEGNIKWNHPVPDG